MAHFRFSEMWSCTFIWYRSEGRAPLSFDFLLLDVIQSMNKRIEVLTEIHLCYVSKHPADADGEAFFLGKDPAIAIGDSAEIKMDELEFLSWEIESGLKRNFTLHSDSIPTAFGWQQG